MSDLRRSIKNKKKENPNLPFELIHEIMLRLPVRSLLRFKCVCKSWFTFISDPKFAESHFDLAAAPTHRVIMNSPYNEVESVDLEASLQDDSASLNLSIALPGEENKDNSLEILCSCRGFLLLVNDEGDLFLWNPATRVHKHIPESVDFNFNLLHGIGYDPSTEDYFVVLIALDHHKMHLDGWIPRIEFFSLNTNTSYQIKGVNLRYKEWIYYSSGVFLNGAIHWLVVSLDTDLDVIIAFNLTEKTLSEIPLSHDLATKVMDQVYYLRVMGGCLSLCYCGLGHSPDMAEIWIMKDYKVQSSWTKTTVLSTRDIHHLYFFPICFTEDGGVIGSNGHGRLMKFNDKGELLEFRTFWPEYKRALLDCGMYRESVRSLPSDFEEASEDETSEEDQQ